MTFSSETLLEKHREIHRTSPSSSTSVRCKADIGFSDGSAVPMKVKTQEATGGSLVHAVLEDPDPEPRPEQQLVALQTADGSFLLPIDGLAAEQLLTEIAAGTAANEDGPASAVATNAIASADQQHKEAEEINKPTCGVCGKVFSSAKARNVHLKNLHPADGQTWSCPQCAKTFPNRRYLAEHLKTHSEEKSFACHTCGASFALERYLKRHRRIHTGEKPYECKDCGKRFSATSNLSEHKRLAHPIHTSL